MGFVGLVGRAKIIRFNKMLDYDFDVVKKIGDA